jgi:UDP-N-acetylglucosamine:LPS N-acetylglucosamine transferase
LWTFQGVTLAFNVGVGVDVHVDALRFAWLLPKCSVVVCHGGAGVINSILCAGIPMDISPPLMGDQFTFTKLLEAKGLGSQARQHLNTITNNKFKSSLEKTMKCKEAAAITCLKIQSLPTTGVDKLYQILVGAV